MAARLRVSEVFFSLQALVLGKIHCAFVKIISDKWYKWVVKNILL